MLKSWWNSNQENINQKHEWKIFLISTFIILAFAGFMSFKNIGNGFYWDDFHLIRSFTSAELKNVWHGEWDPDHIETPGYRPLTPYFNNLRYRLFGENVVAQRIFLVSLFVIIVVAWGRFLRKIGLSNLLYLIISILVISARNSAYHFNWISDGIHLLQGILFVTCAWLLYLSVFKSNLFYKYVFFALSLVIYTISFLVREDSVIIIGAAFLLNLYLLYSSDMKHKRQSVIVLGIYLIMGCLITFVVLYIGKMYVPGRMISINLTGFIQQLKFTIFLAGLRGGNLYYFVAALPIILVSGTLLHSIYKKTHINLSRYVLFIVMLILTLISCLPGLTVHRSNLTFFSVLFYCTWLGTGIFIFTEYISFPFLKKVLSVTFVLLLIPILIKNISASLALQESTAYPINNMLNSTDLIWGKYKNAAVPEARRQKAISELNNLGITKDNYKTEIPLLICNAYREGIIHPTKQGDVFFPTYYFLSDDVANIVFHTINNTCQ